MAVLGQSSCQPNRIYGPLPQTSFLGCSVISFVMSQGWNEQASELTVELVQDPCISRKIWWDENLNRQSGERADPGFKYPEPGSPVYFRIETDPDAATPAERGGFEYSGLVSSWTEKTDSAGNPIFTVKISDPRDVLGNSQVVLNNYTGSVFNIYNLINVQGFVEAFGESCSSSLSGGISSFVSERGVLWENIKCALHTLTSTIDRSNIPFNFQQYCKRNRLVYVGPRNLPNSSTPDSGEGLFPVDDNLNLDTNLSFIPNANLNICEYLLDLTEIPLSPDHYRISGPNISLIELISQVCQDAGCEYYVELLPIKDNLGNIFKVIKVRVSIKESQPPMGAIAEFIGLKTSEQSFMAGTIGQELRPEPTSIFLMGGRVRYPYIINSDCNAQKCVWSLQGDKKGEYSYSGISSNCPSCCECTDVSQNIIDDANDPFFPDPPALISTPCKPVSTGMCDPAFYPYFGKDHQGNLHKISYNKIPVTGLELNEEIGQMVPTGLVSEKIELVVNVDVTELNQTLRIPIVDAFDRPFARVSDSELRAALDNIDSWKLVCFAKKLEMGRYLEAIGFNFDEAIRNLAGMVGFTGNLDGVVAGANVAFHQTTEIGEEKEELLTKVYNFTKDFANTYYGKQFLIQVDGVCETRDFESNGFRYSQDPSPEGCWIADSVDEIGPNGALGLKHNTSQSDFFRDDQGKYQPILLYPNLGRGIDGSYPYLIDLDQMSKDSYISSLDEIHSTGTGISETGVTWVRATIDPEWVRGTSLGPCRDNKCSWLWDGSTFIKQSDDCSNCCECPFPNQEWALYKIGKINLDNGDIIETPCLECGDESCFWKWSEANEDWSLIQSNCPQCCSCPKPFFNGQVDEEEATTKCSICSDELCEWTWVNDDWVLSQFNCPDCCQSPPDFNGEVGQIARILSTCDAIGNEICALLTVNTPVFAAYRRPDNIAAQFTQAIAGAASLVELQGINLNAPREGTAFHSHSRSDIIMPAAPPILMPSGALVPLVDNTLTYGPWGSGGLPGSVMFESDEGFVPWEYYSDRIMNIAAFEKVSNSVTQFRKSERGSVQLAGFPELPLGSEIMALDSNSPPASVTTQRFLETRSFNIDSCSFPVGLQLNSYTIPMGAWTGQYGPSITQINVNIGPQGFTTDYQFSTYTPQFGRFNKSNAERLKKIGQERLNSKRETNANKKLLTIQSSQAGASRDYRNSLASSSIAPATAHGVLVGGYIRQGIEYSGITPNKFRTTANINTDAYKYFSNSISSSGIYQKTAFMSWDGLIRPVSKTGSGGLPRYPSGQPTGFPNRQDLDPFKSGHDIHVVAFGSGFHPNGMVDVSMNSGFESGNLQDYRFMALKAPLVVAGWGYDTDGKPIPNVQDSGSISGVFKNSVESGEFLSGYLSNANTWPVAPVDMRYDRQRQVWVAGGGGSDSCHEIVFQIDCVSGTSQGNFDNLIVSGRVIGIPGGCESVPDLVTASDDICRVRLHDLLHCLWREDSTLTNQTWLGRRGFAHYIQPFNPSGCNKTNQSPVWAIHSLCCPNQASSEPGIFYNSDRQYILEGGVNMDLGGRLGDEPPIGGNL
jgi:hypothetical protein